MGITHKFTSPKADGADATLVRPSNWNDSHNIDLSDLYVGNETPGGTIDGNNLNFTLAATPKPSTSLQLYRGNLFLVQGTHYTLSGASITFISGKQPQAGETLKAFYWRLP